MQAQNILVVSDLHEPFCLDDYLSFCKGVYKKYRCNKVIFIGDIIDNHYTSYHESDPDGYSAGHELDLAIKRLKAWYKAFPVADVTIGNHDRLAARKIFSGGVSKRWRKEYKDVLEVPNWNFQNEFTYNGVLYVHGEGQTARMKSIKESRSVVQGHRHIEGYVHFHQMENRTIFGMQVGCGVDENAYALAYSKHYPKQIIGCGVVLKNGTQPIFIPKLT